MACEATVAFLQEAAHSGNSARQRVSHCHARTHTDTAQGLAAVDYLTPLLSPPRAWPLLSLRFLYKAHTTAASPRVRSGAAAAVSSSELCSASERDWLLPQRWEMAAVPLPWPLAVTVSVRRSLQEGAAGAASYAQAQRAPQQGAARSATTARSVETLVVIVAAIVLAAVLAGVLARVCGGRHVMPSAEYHEEEGWVEKRCRSCLDSGLPPPPSAQGSSKTSEAK